MWFEENDIRKKWWFLTAQKGIIEAMKNKNKVMELIKLALLVCQLQ